MSNNTQYAVPSTSPLYGYCGGVVILNKVYNQKPLYTTLPELGSVESAKRLRIQYRDYRNRLVVTDTRDLAQLDVLETDEKSQVVYKAWKVGASGVVLLPKRIITRTVSSRSVRPNAYAHHMYPAGHNTITVLGIHHLYHFCQSTSRSDPFAYFVPKLYFNLRANSGLLTLCAIKHNTRPHGSNPLSNVGASLYALAKSKGMQLRKQHKWFLLKEPDCWVSFPFPLFSNVRYKTNHEGYKGKAESIMFALARESDPNNLPQIEALDDVRI